MSVGVVKQTVMLNEKIEGLNKKLREIQNAQIDLNVRLSQLENNKKH